MSKPQIISYAAFSAHEWASATSRHRSSFFLRNINLKIEFQKPSEMVSRQLFLSLSQGIKTIPSFTSSPPICGYISVRKQQATNSYRKL